MTNVARALYRFFSGFSLPAYVENSVPDDAELPYITYQLIDPDWRADGTSLYARIWYKDTSYNAVSAKVDEIKAEVGEMASIPTEGGAIYIAPSTPYVQVMPMDDTTIKAAYMLFTLIGNTR